MAVEVPQSISDAGNIVLADDLNASALIEHDMQFSNLTVNGIGHEVYRVVLSKDITFRSPKDFLYALAGCFADATGGTARQTHVFRFGFNGFPLSSSAWSLFSAVPGEYATGTAMVAIAGGTMSLTFPFTTTLTLQYSGSTNSGGMGRLRGCWMETRIFRR